MSTAQSRTPPAPRRSAFRRHSNVRSLSASTVTVYLACAGLRQHQNLSRANLSEFIRTTGRCAPRCLFAAERAQLAGRPDCSISLAETRTQQMSAEDASSSGQTAERSGLAGRITSIRNIRDLAESYKDVKKGEKCAVLCSGGPKAGRAVSVRSVRVSACQCSVSAVTLKPQCVLAPYPCAGRVIRCARPADASTEDVSILLDELHIRDLVGHSRQCNPSPHQPRLLHTPAVVVCDPFGRS